jgi:hypothetical protein
VIEQERQRAQPAEHRAQQERQLREELLDRLRERGINLDDLLGLFSIELLEKVL